MKQQVKLGRKLFGIFKNNKYPVSHNGGYFNLSASSPVTRTEFFDLIEKLPLATIIIDPYRTIRYANMSALYITGFSELTGKDLSDILPVESDYIAVKNNNRLCPHAKTLLNRKNMEMLPVTLFSSMVNIQQKEYCIVNMVLKSQNDFQGMVPVEDEISVHSIQNRLPDFDKNEPMPEFRSNTMSETELGNYFEVFEGISDSVYMLDFNGAICDANSMGYKRLGYSREELLKMNFKNTLTVESGSAFQQFLNRIGEDNTLGFEAQQVAKEEVLLPVEINASTINFSGQRNIILTARNISSCKKTQEELIKLQHLAHDSEKELSAIFNSSANPMFLINKSYQVLRLNTTAIRKFNITDNEPNGKRIGTLINCVGNGKAHDKCGFNEKCKKCNLFKLLKMAIDTNTIIEKEEIEINIADKEITKPYTVLTSVNPTINSQGNHILVTLDDITERKTMEQELLLAKPKAEESDRLKTVFLNNLSHELRTPLNGIMGFSELLIISEDFKEIKQYADLIRQSGKRLLGVIEDLFTVSSIISKTINIKPKDLKLADFIENVKILLHDEHISLNSNKVSLNFNITNSLNGQQVHIDPAVYLLIIKKLINNAFKFTPEGRVEFGIPEISNQSVTLYVKDNGIGIEKDKHEQIFQLFRQIEEDATRHYGGTGSGLSIAKNLVELSKGEIWVESEPGKGSTFYFTMPVSKHPINLPSLKEGITKQAGSNLSLNGKKILVVEDDNFNFLLLEAYLSGSGANVYHAPTGIDAVLKVEEIKDLDLVLMDIRLPDISGYKATQQIKTINSSLPVIAQTSFSMPEDIEKAFESGCDEFITKPISNSKLLEKIAVVIK